MRSSKLNLKVFSTCCAFLFIMVAGECGIYFFEDEKKPVLITEALKEVQNQEVREEEKREETFLILNEKTGEVEEISAYDYALGAVMAEMPPSYHQEALKAQSLSALTRARYLKKKYEEGNGAFENCHFAQNPDENEGFIRPENASAVYGKNTEAYMDKMKKAASFAVKREIVYEDEPILAAYHAMSAGFTESCESLWDRSLPYLVKRESRGDTLSPDFTVTEEIPKEKVRLILQNAFPNGKFPDGGEKSWIVPQSFRKGGYVALCRAGGEDTDGKTVRKLLSLRSHAFTVDFKDDKFLITTKGYGHGVGLSQVGSDFMARQGKTAEEIIEYYYKGAEVNLI